MKTELFQVKKESYNGNYEDHLFEQYKSYVEGMEKVSDKRDKANNLYILINTGILSLIGAILSEKFILFNSDIIIFISIAGIAISYLFWHLINSYKQLNTAKFKVIHKIEERLPLSLYKYEWVECLEEGKNKEVYYPFSHIELIIPWVFSALYFFLIIYKLVEC